MTRQDSPKSPAPNKQGADDEAQRDEDNPEAGTEEEKIKREQATKPALMPIGDPAGAA